MAHNHDWTSDPALADRMQEEKARSELVRGAIIWTPPALILLGLFLFFLWDRLVGPEYGATWFLVVLLGIFTALVGFMAVSSWRDIIGGTREMEGLITRVWSRRDSFVWQTHYFRVNDKILRIRPEAHAQLAAGMRVRVTFYPHAGIAVRTERLPDEDAQGEDSEAGSR